MLPRGQNDAFAQPFMGHGNNRVPNALILVGPAADQFHRRVARLVVIDNDIAVLEGVHQRLQIDGLVIETRAGGARRVRTRGRKLGAVIDRPVDMFAAQIFLALDVAIGGMVLVVLEQVVAAAAVRLRLGSCEGPGHQKRKGRK